MMHYKLWLAVILSVSIGGHGVPSHETCLVQQPGQRLDMHQLTLRSIRSWFSLQEQVALNQTQREQLWQTLTEVLQLYTDPDIDRYHRYLQRRKGQIWLPKAFYERWQEHYGTGKGVWQQLIGAGHIEVFQADQPVTAIQAMQYIADRSKAALALSRYSVFPGGSERPCLYALVQFTAAPPPLPAGSVMEIPRLCGGVEQYPMSDAPRTYFLWLRWDASVRSWWIDVAGVDRADPRPRHYDLLF